MRARRAADLGRGRSALAPAPGARTADGVAGEVATHVGAGAPLALLGLFPGDDGDGGAGLAGRQGDPARRDHHLGMKRHLGIKRRAFGPQGRGGGGQGKSQNQQGRADIIGGTAHRSAGKSEGVLLYIKHLMSLSHLI